MGQSFIDEIGNNPNKRDWNLFDLMKIINNSNSNFYRNNWACHLTIYENKIIEILYWLVKTLYVWGVGHKQTCNSFYANTTHYESWIN